MTNREIAQLISERIGERPVPFEAVRQLALDIYHDLGGQEDDENFEDIFEILLSIVPLTDLIDDSSTVLDKTWSSYKIDSEISSAQAGKLDIVVTPNVVYGTNASGEQISYVAGSGISFANGQISNTNTDAAWGNITGTLSNQTDLQNALDLK